MKHVLTTAAAGAQSLCTQKTQKFPALPGMGTIQEQRFFTPVHRRDLERSIRSLRRDLGFSTSDQAVLIALMSFLPCFDRGQERPIGPDLLLTIFASNDALCNRAGGIDERTLRRCINRLEKDGWVIRRDSANGKRFARKSKNKIVAAFGIDISPLLQKSANLIDRAKRKAEIEEEKRGLIAEAKALIVECERQPDLPALLDFKFFRTALRRVTMTIHHVKEMIQTLKDHLTGSASTASENDQEALATATQDAEQIAGHTDHRQTASVYRSHDAETGEHTKLPVGHTQISRACTGDDQKSASHIIEQPCDKRPDPINRNHETTVLPASDGQNARHKETRISESKYTRTHADEHPDCTWETCSELKAFFPERPRSTHAITQLLFDAGRLLRIADALVSDAIQKLPLSTCMTILDTMMQQAAEIVSPDGYFRSMIPGGFKT